MAFVEDIISDISGLCQVFLVSQRELTSKLFSEQFEMLM
jgi:hypothetical protein